MALRPSFLELNGHRTIIFIKKKLFFNGRPFPVPFFNGTAIKRIFFCSFPIDVALSLSVYSSFFNSLFLLPSLFVYLRKSFFKYSRFFLKLNKWQKYKRQCSYIGEEGEQQNDIFRTLVY